MFALFFVDDGLLGGVVPRGGVEQGWSKGVKGALEQGLKFGTGYTKKR